MTETTTQTAGLGVGSAAPPASSRQGRRRIEPKNVGEIGALLVLIILFSVLNPQTFPTLTNLRVVLDPASVPLIIGVGATLVILMGSIDLSVEGVMGAAGMTFVLLSANDRNANDLGFGAILAAIAVGIGLGLVSGLIHTLLKVPSFIVTLGVWYVGLGIATILLGSSSIPYLADTELSGWPSRLFLGLPNDFWLAVLVMAVGIVLTRFTRLGRFTYAIGDSEQIARDNGVAVPRFKVYVFILAGACSAWPGLWGACSWARGPSPSASAPCSWSSPRWSSAEPLWRAARAASRAPRWACCCSPSSTTG